jgi:hypothetical protein
MIPRAVLSGRQGFSGADPGATLTSTCFGKWRLGKLFRFRVKADGRRNRLEPLDRPGLSP